MSELHGRSIIAGEAVGGGGKSFRAFKPSEGREFGPEFYEAMPVEIDRALVAAAQAFPEYCRRSGEQVAGFLENIGLKIEALGDELIERAHEETALPAERLTGERARTVNQLRMFAAAAREGSWGSTRLLRIPGYRPRVADLAARFERLRSKTLSIATQERTGALRRKTKTERNGLSCVHCLSVSR